MYSRFIFGGSLAELLRFGDLQLAFFEEASYEMRFLEIADARNAVFFHTKCVSEARRSSSAEPHVRDGLASWSDHARIMLGSFSDRPRSSSEVSTALGEVAVDGILW